MNLQHKAVRELLQSMAPNRAIAFIKAFNLPEEEERILIECDVRRRQYASLVTDKDKPTSAEVIKKKKHSGYAHMLMDDEVDEISAIKNNAYRHMMEQVKN